MVLADQRGMEASKQAVMKTMLGILILLLTGACRQPADMVEYRALLDSLNRIVVPVVLDITDFKNNLAEGEPYTKRVSADGMVTLRYEKERFYVVAERHTDSLFWRVYQYGKNGCLYEYYSQYINGDYITDMLNDRIGLTVRYDEKGKVTEVFEYYPTPFFTIRNVLDILIGEQVDLFDCFIGSFGANRSDSIFNFFWFVANTVPQGNPEVIYRRMREIDMATGTVQKDTVFVFPVGAE